LYGNQITNIMKTLEKLELNRAQALAPYQEIQKDRVRRYFDCQDDTILGGISDQVTSATINKINRKYDLIIEQELNGGFLSRAENTICLYKNGVMVSDKLRDGKFGKFFVLTDGTFISVAKKKATFEKKGLEVKVLTTNYKCNFNGITDKGYVMYSNIEIVSINERDFDFYNDNFYSNNWIGYLYNNK
jgi:hypothetical protein